MADFDKTIYTQKASEKLINHLQNNDFLLEVKKAIDDKPTEYKEIIQSHIENIPPVGKVMTLAVLREWKAAKTIDELYENEKWKIVTDDSANATSSVRKSTTTSPIFIPESPKSSSDGKKQKAAKVLQRNIRKFAHKNETSKLQRKQKQKRLEEADERRERATRKVKSKTSRTSSALEVLRSQREQHTTPTVSSRYSKGVLVSSTHKVGKNKLGGGKKRHTMKKHRK